MTGTVTGYTLEKIKAIVDASVTNAFISDSGNLILETEDGTQINAGPVAGTFPTYRESIVSIGSIDVPARDVIVPDWNVGGYNTYLTPAFFYKTTNFNSFFTAKVTGLAWNPASVGFNLLKFNGGSGRRSYDTYQRFPERFREVDTYTTANTTDAPNGLMAWSPDGTYLAASNGAAPRLIIYKRSGTYPQVTKLTDPAVLPAGNVRGISWSPNGLLLAVFYDVSPYAKIYSRSGDVFTDISGVFFTAPSAAGWRCDFSPNGKYLAACYDGQAPVVYKRSGTIAAPVFTPLTLPGSVAAINPRDISWSPDGRYLAFTHYGTNGEVVVLKRTGDTFAKLAGLNTTATNSAVLDWSPDGRYLVFADTSYTAKFQTKRFVNDAFELVNTPLTVPTGNVLDLKFSPDGLYLTLAQDTPPYVMGYRSEGGSIDAAVVPVVVKS